MGLIIKDNKVKGYIMEENITEATIPDGIIEIEESCFYAWKEIKRINIPPSVEKIGIAAFENCESLREIILPPNIKEIDEFLFYCCKSLEKIIIPNGVVTLGNGAFAFCENLKEITLPPSIEKIDLKTTRKFYKSIPTFFRCLNIEKINLYSYNVFSMLSDELKLIAIFSFLENYYTSKINYINEDIRMFKEYIKENKKEIFYKSLTNTFFFESFCYILNKMDVYVSEDIDMYLNEFDLLKNRTEVKAVLLNYKNKKLGFKNPLDKYNLDDNDEEKGNEKNNKK